MKLILVPETFDVIPPGMLDQLMTALVATGNLYGYKLRASFDRGEEQAASQRFWDLHYRNQETGGNEGG